MVTLFMCYAQMPLVTVEFSLNEPGGEPGGGGGGMGGMPLVVMQEAFLAVNSMTNKTYCSDDTEFLLFANQKTAQKSR